KHLEEALRQRKRDGFIRDCHGDLHLGNIATVENQPLLFDGIEFNDQLRCIDTISEMAFLITDLEYFGANEAAAVCLNSYLFHTDDYRGLPLLNFYKVYRALVRAKVSLIKSQQDNDPIHLQRYTDYCQLAETYTKEPSGSLFITHGVSGSGKTTLAKKVVNQYGAIHLRSDVIRKRLFGLKPQSSSRSTLNDDIYSESATTKTYEAMADLSHTLLQAGFNVVADAAFLKISERSRFSNIAENIGSDFFIVDCELDRELAIERIQSRKNDPSEATVEVLEHQLAHRDLLSVEEIQHRVVLGTACI
ncbi:MAG: AAA family ATPase, partial [Pseudomonadales bacterium]|nr:AAA family ATPase [Pseudomonadales bacterium]